MIIAEHDEQPIDDDALAAFEALVDRAQSFDGYSRMGGSTARVEHLLLAVRVAWVEGVAAHYSEADLRTALFGECRRLHHQGGYPPTQRLYAYMCGASRWSGGR